MDVRTGLPGVPTCVVLVGIGLDLSDTSQVSGQPSVELRDGDERLSAAPNDPQLGEDLGVEEASANADAIGRLGRGQRQPAVSG